MEIEVPGTWELDRQELGNFETWELRNFVTHSRVSSHKQIITCDAHTCL